MTFVLRTYQKDWVAEINRLRAEGWSRLLVDAPGGVGKSTVFAALALEEWTTKIGRVLILENRDKLVRQTADRIRSETGLECDIEMADSHASPFSPIVVASVATLGRITRLAGFADNHFSLIVPDECFPAGTLVDGRRIEDIRPGDFVTSFNHTTGQTERKKVLRLFNNTVASLVRIEADGRSIVCTPSHPFFTDNGYIKAKDLCGRKCAVLKDYYFPMQALRKTGGVPRTDAIFPQPSGGDRKKGALLEEVRGRGMDTAQSGHSKEAGRMEPEAFVRAHEEKQSDEKSGCGGENEAHEQGQDISFEGRQWNAHETANGAIDSSGRPPDGVCDPYRIGQRKVSFSPALLQGGHCGAGMEAGYRSGWWDSQREEMEVSGRQKNGCLEFARVDSVEVLESRGGPGHPQVCPDGFVYNFEVEGNNNYFVDGVLVHNCHHSMAPLFQRVMFYFHYGAQSLEENWDAPKDGTYTPLAHIVGFTATPDIGTTKNLGTIYQKMAVSYSYLQAIEDGWLVGLREENIPVKIDTRKFKIKRGGQGMDFSAEDESAAIIPIIEELADQIVKLASDKKTMAFLPSLECARLMADALNRKGLNAVFVSGKCLDRNEKTDLFHAAGPGNVLCLCALYVEGADFPTVDCIAWLRATISKAFYKQGIYRVTRVLPGVVSDAMTADERRAAIAASLKPHGLVISPFFISDRIDICEVFDLYGQRPEKGLPRKKPDFTKPAEVRDFLAALEDAADKHKHKQARTINPVSYSLSLGLQNFVPSTPSESAKASKEELDLLLKHGIDTTQIKCSGEAQRLVSRLRERERLGLATPMQLVQLRLQLGWPEEKVSVMKSKQAGVLIWKRVTYKEPTKTAPETPSAGAAELPQQSSRSA